MSRADESRAFLDAIRETPDDDTPRLVYADWLDDHGDATRAEFIRVQCELAKLAANDERRAALAKRDYELWRTHWDEWLGPLVKAVRYSYDLFRRGFPENLIVRPKAMVKLAEEFDARVPAGRVTLYGGFGDPAMKMLMTCPHLDWVAGLKYEHPRFTEAGLEMIANSATMPRLTELSVLFANSTTRGIQALAASPHRMALRCLTLHHFGGGPPATAVALAGPEVRFRLRSLTLHGNALGPAGAAVLAGTENLAELKELDLILNNLQDEGAIALARSPHLRGLSSLVLQTNNLSSRSVRALADSPLLDGIRTLNLAVNEVGDEGAAALAACPRLARLQHLILYSAHLTDRGAEALAASPHLSNLTHLGLMGNSLTDCASQALFESPHLRSLEHISLPYLAGIDRSLHHRQRKQWKERLGTGARV